MILHHSCPVKLTSTSPTWICFTRIIVDSNEVPISGYFCHRVHHWNLPASWSLWSPNLYNDPSNYTLYHHPSKLAWIRTWLNRFCGDGIRLTQLKHCDQLLSNNQSINRQVIGGRFNIPTSKMLWPTAQHLSQERERDNMAWHHFPPLLYRVIQKNTTSNIETEQISEVPNAPEFPCFTFKRLVEYKILWIYRKEGTNHTWKITLLDN